MNAKTTSKVGREHSELITDEGKLSFRYGEQRIRFLRVENKLTTQKVSVKVLPEGFVEVSAPKTMGDKELINIVRQRGAWIVKQLAGCEGGNGTFDVPNKDYVSGATHRYLGRQYLLKVTESENKNEPETVKLRSGKFEISVVSKMPSRVKSVLDRWYERKAGDVFERRLPECLKKTPWVKHRPKIKLLRMEKQWGNCSPDGNLTLNVHLVEASNLCIDYVLLHELCHIAEHNHSPRFYQLLGRIMPEWKRVKQHLDNG